jgi:hypothetical protein
MSSDKIASRNGLAYSMFVHRHGNIADLWLPERESRLVAKSDDIILVVCCGLA